MTSNHLGGNPSASTGRRIAAAGVGVSLVTVTLFSVYQTAWRIYYDYYFFALVKEEWIAPDRRVRVMDGLYFVTVIVVLYIVYRLLRYAIRPRGVANH